MILAHSLFIATAAATTYAPTPDTVRDQINHATLVGEFSVVSTTTEILEDGFPVTHAELKPVQVVKGEASSPILILPGGVVEGKFQRIIPDGFQVKEGESLFLMLEEAKDRPGYYLVAHSFRVGVFRRVETSRGALMADTSGRYIADITCDARPTYVTNEATPSRDTDHDEDSREIAGSVFTNVIVDDDPESLGAPWSEGVSALASCGGAR